jgi:hypothetical protein
MKDDGKLSIYEKIPHNIKPFNRSDIENSKFSSNHSSILNIMIKWAVSL